MIFYYWFRRLSACVAIVYGIIFLFYTQPCIMHLDFSQLKIILCKTIIHTKRQFKHALLQHYNQLSHLYVCYSYSHIFASDIFYDFFIIKCPLHSILILIVIKLLYSYGLVFACLLVLSRFSAGATFCLVLQLNQFYSIVLHSVFFALFPIHIILNTHIPTILLNKERRNYRGIKVKQTRGKN